MLQVMLISTDCSHSWNYWLHTEPVLLQSPLLTVLIMEFCLAGDSQIRRQKTLLNLWCTSLRSRQPQLCPEFYSCLGPCGLSFSSWLKNGLSTRSTSKVHVIKSTVPARPPFSAFSDTLVASPWHRNSLRKLDIHVTIFSKLY